MKRQNLTALWPLLLGLLVVWVGIAPASMRPSAQLAIRGGLPECAYKTCWVHTPRSCSSIHASCSGTRYIGYFGQQGDYPLYCAIEIAYACSGPAPECTAPVTWTYRVASDCLNGD